MPALDRSHAWLLYVAGVVTVALVYLLPGSPLNVGPVFNLLGVSSVVAILIAARVHHIARLAWGLIAVGQTSFVLGDILAYNYPRFFGSELPFPSVADVFYLATYPFLIGGLVLLVRQRTPTHDRASLIDTLIVTVAAGTLSWTLLIAPYAHDASLSFLTKLTSVAYPVMDLGVLACVVRFAFGRGRRPVSFFLLTAATISLFVTDSIYGWLLLHGGYETGGLLDSGWIAFYVLTGAAALHPRMPELVAAARDTQYRLTNARLTTFAACSLAAPAVLLGASLTSGARDVPLLAACSATVFVLVFLRLRDLAKRHERVISRATVLAEVGVKLIEAHTRGDVADAAIAAASQMVGRGGQARLVDDADSSTAIADASDRTLVLPLGGRNESRGALVVEGATTFDADTADALRALATEVALALDSVAMAEDLLRKRTEARFQSLVQNSSDVILVIDTDGRIDFASPAALRVFGYTTAELEGQPLMDIVAEADRARVAQAVLSETSCGSGHTSEFELDTRHGVIAVEAICTNLVDDENVAGIVLNVRDVSERKEFERQLAHQAFHDEVSGLANRALFRDRVDHALERTRRAGSAVSVLFIDLDDFKMVNDTLGHRAGDELLRTVGDRIAATVRAVDTAARLGGDEFAVLIEDDDGTNAVVVAERIQCAISEPTHVDARELTVTASIGIAHTNGGSEASSETLLRNADVAMYSAKGSGRGLFRLFEPKMHTALVERLELKRALQIALERNEFELHYQPIINLESGAIISLEALLRWRHPERGLIPPDRFIPLAEDTGLIIPIGSWALEQACIDGARLLRMVGDAAPSISVNLSGRQLLHPELVDEIDATLARTTLPPSRLVLEITETVMMADLDLALTRLDQLKTRGIKLAIDDFGSGYSSLNYVRRFPVDILKVDRSFVADVATPGEVSSLTGTIIDLAEILGVTAVAEGIENSAQLDELRRMGCSLGQGFLFMRPSEVGDVEALVMERLVTGNVERHAA